MHTHRFAPALLALALAACGGDTAVNWEVYRAGPDDELELESKGCVLREQGAAVGGGANEYAVRYEDAPAGGVTVTYFVPPEARSVEVPVEEDDDDVKVAAVLELSKEELLSGEIHMLSFAREDGAQFEALHWGSDSCD